MEALLDPVVSDLDQQTVRYRAAVEDLQAALQRQQVAKAYADQTKDALDDAKAEYMGSPVFKRLRHRAPAEEREANVRAALAVEVEASREAKAALWHANAEVAQAQANERAERAIFYGLLFRVAPEWYKSKQDPVSVESGLMEGPPGDCALDDSA